jgi:hypothetical protein
MWPTSCTPDAVNLKSTAFFALICVALATVLLLFGFARDLLSAINGLVPALRVVASLVNLLAGLSVTLFLYVFDKMQ